MRHALLAGLAALLVAACAAPPPGEATGPVAVRLLAINDFHGNLEPPLGGLRIPDPADRTKTVDVPAGGAAHLARAVAALEAGHPNHAFVAAGDLVGASPLLSALFHDEPTVESLSAMGLVASAVGNHEFDHGAAELLRLQHGGCHPVDGCRGPQPFRGAGFQYLAASTVDTATGRTLLPPYVIRRFEGVPVAFVGLTLKGTPGIVVPSGVAGLAFRDEAETVNALVPELRRQGVEAIVVLLHEGGLPSGGYDECPGLSGPIVGIVQRLDRAVDVVVSGHTHRAYNCRIDGRLVTSADKYGTLVTAIDLQIDRRTHDVLSAQAENVVVSPARFAAEPAQQALIAGYAQRAAPLAERPVGTIAAPLARDVDAAGESPLGRVIADAQLAATRDAGAQIALTNRGGLRAALARPADGVLRHAALFAVQPFGNNLVTLTLSGAELAGVLEAQWIAQPVERILQVSRGFAYTWDAAQPPGRRVVPGSLALDGRPIAPDEPLRVTVNSFLAAGGDGFAALRAGRDATTGMTDLDALEAYAAAHPGLAADAAPRITRRP